MATFNRWEFWDILDDIEKYLGYLKGNELAQEYWESYLGWERSYLDDGGRGMMSAWEYNGKCPEGRFKLFRRAPIMVPMGVSDQTWRDQLTQGWDAAWDNGSAWATGLADYCKGVTDQITSPSVTTLTSGIATIQTNVVSVLKESALDDWAHLGGAENIWTGLAALEFRELYDNYNDHLNLYAFYQGYAALTFAMCGATVSQFQAALVPFVTDLRDHLEYLLEEWVYTVPREPKPLPAWVVNTTAIIGDIFNVVAGVNKAVDAVGDIVGRIESLVNVANQFEKKGTEKTFPVASAEDIYTTLTDTLYNDYYTGMQNAFSDMATGKGAEDIDLGGDLEQETLSSSDIAGRLDARSGTDWFMPDPGTGDLNNDPSNYGSYY